MDKYLDISNSKTKSYLRKYFINDKIYDFYHYKEFTILFSSKGIYFENEYFKYLLEHNYLKQEVYDEYCLEVINCFNDISYFDDYSVEEIYEYLLKISKKYFEDEIIYLNNDESIDGLNQEDIFYDRLNKCKAVIMILDDINETNIFNYYRNKIDKEIYILKSDSLALDLNKLEYDAYLQELIDHDECILLVFGEGAYLACRDLKIDSFVIGKARSYYCKALVNNLKGRHFIYVPKHFNIQDYIKLTNKSKLTYSQLYYLWKDIGLSIYDNISALNNLYPEYFDNIYQNDNAKMDFPDLNNFNYQKIKYHIEDNNDIVMHTVNIANPLDIKVIKNIKQNDIHEILKEYKGTYIVSNFLFFTTTKLMKFYNIQRSARSDEMIDESYHNHLDYLKDDSFESIPLYNKANIGITYDNKLSFFHLDYPSGYISVDNKKYEFDYHNYNCFDDKDLIIYTPYLSLDDNDNDDYRLEVGKNRFNIVYLQDKIVCFKNDSVLLPCAGFVLSFKQEININDLKIYLNETKDYKQVYGGGMMLIDKGIDFNLDSLKKEGWISPLSKLSQDTPIEKVSKNPRTAIGKLVDGSIIINVFDGRNSDSEGATYTEMCEVIRNTYPDIEYLMNVDGGASSFLGICKDGVFKEISLPSSSFDNVVGQARNVMTLLLVRVE